MKSLQILFVSSSSGNSFPPEMTRQFKLSKFPLKSVKGKFGSKFFVLFFSRKEIVSCSVRASNSLRVWQGAIEAVELRIMSTLSIPELYQQVACIPYVASAFFDRSSASSDPPAIVVSTSQRDIDQDSTRSFSNTFRWQASSREYASNSVFPVETTGVSASLPSPSGKYYLILRKGKAKKPVSGEDNTFVFEILQQNRVIASISTEGLHGKVYASAILGGLSWSPNEAAIAYVAEAKAPLTASFWETSRSGTDDENEKKETEKKIKGAQFEFRDDIGEEFPTTVAPRLFVVDWMAKTIKSFCNFPADSNFGQVRANSLPNSSELDLTCVPPCSLCLLRLLGAQMVLGSSSLPGLVHQEHWD